MSATERQDAPLRLLVIGAHPDDAEFHVGGTLRAFCLAGHVVHVISVTDGGAGHQTIAGPALAARRREEATRAAALCGFTIDIWSEPDGQLTASLDVRMQVIRAIRRFAPDLLITHRTNDYHPDHRAVGQLVQDASYMVRVPAVAADVPALRADPVVMFMADFFSRPNPFRADVIIDVDAHMPLIVDLLDCHASQVYEWLPWLDGRAAAPTEPEPRKAWLRDWLAPRPRLIANRHRDALRAAYGDAGERVVHAEALEESEYARRLSPKMRARLFAWLFAQA